MDECGCFFKTLPDKGLVEKEKQVKDDKISKKRKNKKTVTFFANVTWEKVNQPIVIWKNKHPHCFKKLQDPSHPANVHYFRILNLGWHLK